MPYAIRKRLRIFVATYLITAWGAAWASLSAAGPDLLLLPWAQAGVGAGVSYIGGFAATLGRKLAAQYENARFHARWEFARDAVVSVVIGLTGYMGGMYQKMDPSLLVVVLLLGGYGGTRTLAVWIDKVVRPRDAAD